MKFSLYKCVLLSVRFLFRLFYRHKVYGLEHFPQGSAIIAANHTSFLDPPLVAISSPQEIHFLAKGSLFHAPFFGSFIRRLNAHPLKREATDMGAFKLVLKLLNEGKKVLVFPEGKRSATGELQPLQKGIAFFMTQAHASIVPTYAHGTHAIWERARRLPKLRGKTACVFGSPLTWQEFSHLDKREAQQAIMERLRTALLALKSWYDAGAKGSPP